MSSSEHPSHFHNTDKLFNAIVCDMHDLYEHTITEREAIDAARNLIGFCQTLLEIKLGKGHT